MRGITSFVSSTYVDVLFEAKFCKETFFLTELDKGTPLKFKLLKTLLNRGILSGAIASLPVGLIDISILYCEHKLEN